MTHEPSVSKTAVIDVFSFNCPICEDAVQVVKEAIVPCGCAVFVRPWEEGPRHVEASEGGIYPVPSLAVNGRVVFHGCPGPGAFAEAIGEMSLSRPTEACASTPSEGAPTKLGEATADSKDFPLDSVPRYGADNDGMRPDVSPCPPSVRSDVSKMRRPV